MTKHLLKYSLFAILIYAILGTGWLFIFGGNKSIFEEKEIIVLIEAGFKVNDDWHYNVAKIIDTIKEKHKNEEIEIYYFNQTYEKIQKDMQGNFNINNISPYGDSDYSLIEKFQQNTQKKIDYLLGSSELEDYTKGKMKFISIKN